MIYSRKGDENKNINLSLIYIFLFQHSITILVVAILTLMIVNDMRTFSKTAQPALLKKSKTFILGVMDIL